MDTKNNVYQFDNKSLFLSATERELFEERSAIMEYDGGLKREQAEAEALAEIILKRQLFQKVV